MLQRGIFFELQATCQTGQILVLHRESRAAGGRTGEKLHLRGGILQRCHPVLSHSTFSRDQLQFLVKNDKMCFLLSHLCNSGRNIYLMNGLVLAEGRETVQPFKKITILPLFQTYISSNTAASCSTRVCCRASISQVYNEHQNYYSAFRACLE